jgi:hypothetical protein
MRGKRRARYESGPPSLRHSTAGGAPERYSGALQVQFAASLRSPEPSYTAACG